MCSDTTKEKTANLETAVWRGSRLLMFSPAKLLEKKATIFAVLIQYGARIHWSREIFLHRWFAWKVLAEKEIGYSYIAERKKEVVWQLIFYNRLKSPLHLSPYGGEYRCRKWYHIPVNGNEIFVSFIIIFSYQVLYFKSQI